MSGAADPHQAVGAYVLHALPADERAAFENHLAGCAACAQEAAELAAAAARLGGAEAMRPSADLKQRVLDQIAVTGQEAPRPAPHSPAGERPRPETPPAAPRGRRLLQVALAACLAAALAFAALALKQHREADDARAQVSRADQRYEVLADMLSAADATILTQRLFGTATGSVIVSRSEGQAAFVASGLPPLPSGKVYELWFAEAGTLRPAALLAGTGEQQMRVLRGPVGGATAIGITVEPEGGSPQPTGKPLGTIPIPA
ncbi:anti-sigma factor [Streptomyces sp. NPDC058572]|uniref:anti-sigma factor n=1 Tax=Streptomyces sp. NPDC058572 TaxID=3346546 RepID=UPI0036523ED4